MKSLDLFPIPMRGDGLLASKGPRFVHLCGWGLREYFRVPDGVPARLHVVPLNSTSVWMLRHGTQFWFTTRKVVPERGGRGGTVHRDQFWVGLAGVRSQIFPSLAEWLFDVLGEEELKRSLGDDLGLLHGRVVVEWRCSSGTWHRAELRRWHLRWERFRRSL